MIFPRNFVISWIVVGILLFALGHCLAEEPKGGELYETRKALGATTDLLKQVLINMEYENKIHQVLRDYIKANDVAAFPDEEKWQKTERGNIDTVKYAIKKNEELMTEYGWWWKSSTPDP